MVRSVRPEVRWGIRVAKVCLPIFVCWDVYVIVTYPSPLAVVGLVTVPVYAAAMGLLLFSVGWAAGVLRVWLRAPTRPPAWHSLLAVVVIGSFGVALIDYGCSEYLCLRARNEAAPPAELAWILDTWWGQRDAFVQSALARNPACPAVVLRELAARTRGELTEFWGLRATAKGGLRPVLLEVLGNRNTPPDALDLLSKIGNVYIRYRLAGEDHLPVDVRKRLACDPEPMVRAATGWACETVGGGERLNSGIGRLADQGDL